MFVATGAIIALVDLFIMYFETGKIWRQGSNYRKDFESVVQLAKSSPTHSLTNHNSAKLVVNRQNIASQFQTRVAGGKQASIVTGIGVGGIGFNTALQLILSGMDVIGVCKTRSEAEEAQRIIHDCVRAADIVNLGSLLNIFVCDLSDTDSVGKLCDTLTRDRCLMQRLAVVVTNAGVMAIPPCISKQGIECQFATHHVGHSLMLLRLIDAKASTRSDTAQMRIIIVGSGAAAGGENPMLREVFQTYSRVQSLVDSGYNRYKSYSNAKLCNIIFASSLHCELASRGLLSLITVNSLHPGPIRSRVVPNSQLPFQWLLDGELAALLRLSPVISATYVVDACLHKRFTGCSGRFLRMGIDMIAAYEGRQNSLKNSFFANTHWFMGIPAPRFTYNIGLQQWLLQETRKFHQQRCNLTLDCNYFS